MRRAGYGVAGAGVAGSAAGAMVSVAGAAGSAAGAGVAGAGVAAGAGVVVVAAGAVSFLGASPPQAARVRATANAAGRSRILDMKITLWLLVE